MTDLPFNPDWTVHPGELVEMFMDDLGLDKAEMARRMGVDVTFVEDLLAAREETAIDNQTAHKLGNAFGMSKDFWLKAEAGYRSDLIRLTPKRVGLFDNSESFAKITGDSGVLMANAFVDGFLANGTEDDRRLVAVLREADDFVVLAEYFRGKVFIEFQIGYGNGTYMAWGPKLAIKLASSILPGSPVAKPNFSRRDTEHLPAILHAERPYYSFARAE